MINQLIEDLPLQLFINDEIISSSVSKYHGKWLVLYFYPGDFTFVCPTELKEAASRYDELKKMNVELISVSTDSVFVHKAWHDSSPAIKSITFPMAADPNGKLSRYFNVYNEDKGESWRATFIINPEGILKAYEVHDTAIGRSISEIIRKLTALQYVAKHHTEVCPASWTTGQKTLTEDIRQVGKI